MSDEKPQVEVSATPTITSDAVSDMTSEHSAPTPETDQESAAPINYTLSEASKTPWWQGRAVVVSSLLIGVLGLFIGSLFLIPRVTIQESGPIIVGHPDSFNFTFTNAALVQLTRFSVSLAVCKLGNLQGPCGSERAEISTPRWQHHTLSADEPLTISLEDLLFMPPGVNLAGADISLIVRFREIGIAWPYPKIFHLVSRRERDGNFYWILVPQDYHDTTAVLSNGT